MKIIVIDGRRFKTRELAHEYLARKLEAPAYYGKNLDALHDILTSCAGETCLRIRYPASIERHLGAYGASLLRVFRDCAQENPNVTLEL